MQTVEHTICSIAFIGNGPSCLHTAYTSGPRYRSHPCISGSLQSTVTLPEIPASYLPPSLHYYHFYHLQPGLGHISSFHDDVNSYDTTQYNSCHDGNMTRKILSISTWKVILAFWSFCQRSLFALFIMLSTQLQPHNSQDAVMDTGSISVFFSSSYTSSL